MNQVKTGELIKKLRTEANLTQLQLAEKINVSDKAVSKWERGLGCPDQSLLAQLADVLGADLNALLSGEQTENKAVAGNLNKTKLYVCPKCANLITASGDANISCCGRTLSELVMQKADEGERLNVELIENDYYITSDHEMTKEHYISFVALVSGDTVILRRLYPEWDLSTRIPRVAHGRLIWYCTRHGLRYQLI